MTDTEVDDEPRCGFSVCIPTPGVPASERCCGAASGMKGMCLPNFLGPFAGLFKKKVQPAPFYGKDSKPSFLIIMIMGLQHMLAMLVGVITPPRLLANEGCLLNRDSDLCSITPNLICSALLASGILSIMQIARVKLCGGYYFGTGLISVMGPSFTFLPIGQAMMQEATLDFSGQNGTGIEWYGKFIGTCMVASFFEILISFVPPKIIKKICPPIVSGIVVFCIGAALTQTGFKYWGGGVFCSQNVMSKPLEGAMNGNRFIMGPHSCMGDNGGERQNPPASTPGAIRPGFAPGGIAGYDAPFGDPVYVGYGALAVLIFFFIAMFGSPFMKSCNIAISFLTTYAISAGFRGPSYVAFPGAVPHDSMLVTGMFSALTSTQNPVSFLWAGITSAPGFSIGFAPEYLLPILMCFLVSTAESIGDITATAKASGLDADDPSIPSRIQGGLLADGVNSFLAALALTPPNTTFSQNTGVISMTNCASRAAGFACCFWLIVAGLFVPFGSFLADAPTCVLGGIVTILFASIMVSGIKIIGRVEQTPRNHIILSMSLGIALGVSTVPHMFDGGGNAAFYGSVLKMNTGAFPLKATCVPGTEVYFSATWGGAGTSTGSDPNRANAFGSYFGSTALPNPTSGMINTTNGFHRGKYLMNPNDWVQSCTIDQSKRAWRTSFLVLINTPYSVGLIVAVLLNMLLPEDTEPEEGSSTAKAAPVAVESGSA